MLTFLGTISSFENFQEVLEFLSKFVGIQVFDKKVILNIFLFIWEITLIGVFVLFFYCFGFRHDEENVRKAKKSFFINLLLDHFQNIIVRVTSINKGQHVKC